MMDASVLRSGKGHRDENFPVASFLIHPRHREPILAFYNFVRTADDIADHAALPAPEKLTLLDRLDRGLTGANDDDAVAVRLRQALNARALSPKHAQDLLTAFRLDVTKLRYRDWDDLMSYCAFSAMPVGRFVCDVHGESRAVWPANDALCAALQIINHLQDCGEDYRNLNRVYIAQDALRLSLEVSVINRLAHRLTRILRHRDPLSEKVHLGIPGVAGGTAFGILHGATQRMGRRRAGAHKPRGA